MKVASLLLVALALLAAGCTTEGGAANPSALAPKVILDERSDGNLTVFVHSAFGERKYDWIRLDADNVTLVNRTEVYSLEAMLPDVGHHISVEAQVQGQLYALQVRIDPDDEEADRVKIALHDPRSGWSEPSSRGLPFERILDRVVPTA